MSCAAARSANRANPDRSSSAAPQQSHRVRHHEPGGLHRVLGAEVVDVTQLARQVDELLQRGSGDIRMGTAQAPLRVGGQPRSEPGQILEIATGILDASGDGDAKTWLEPVTDEQYAAKP